MFSAGFNATGSYTATVSGSVTASSITFEEGAVTLAGTSTPVLTLSGAGGVTINSAINGTTTFASSLNNVVLSLSQNWANNSSQAFSIASGVVASGGAVTLTLNGSGSGGATFSGVLGNGTGTLAITINTTGGVTTFSNTGSTYTGQLTVQSGTLSIGTANNASSNGELGNSANSVILGGSGTTGTLEYTGGTASSNKKFTMATSGTGAFQIDTAPTNLTLSGVIDGSGGLAKTGPGTLTLSAANTYTGATTVNAGTLTLDHSVAGAPATNIINNSSNSSTLTLAGGTFLITGKASTTNSDRVNGLILNSGASAITLNAASSNPLLLTLGTIMRSAGSTINFTLPAGTQSATNGITTTATNANGILGAYATVGANGGTDWATNNGTDIVAYAGYTDIAARSSTITSSAGSNVRFTTNGSNGNVGLSATTTDINTLLENNANVATTIDTAGKTLRFGATGGIFVPSGKQQVTVGTSAGSGTVTAGGAANTNGELILTNNSAFALTVHSNVTDNGTGIVGLTKSGTGSLVLDGTNTYTGGTTLNAGTLQAGSNAALGNANNTLTVNGGTLDLNGNTVGVGNLTGSGGTILNNAASTNVTFSIGNGNTGGGNYQGVIANGTSTVALTKNGSGTITLSGANTYTGATIINNSGTLIAAATSGSALGSTGSITVNSGGTLLLGANNQINDNATMFLAGGTFAKGNFSEGTGSAVGVGALTLNASGSHIDFGTGTVGTLTFLSLNKNTFTLTIDNWTGTADTAGTGTSDRLIFESDQSSNLSAFQFTGYGPGAVEFALGGGFFEVCPIPEPSTWVAGSLALATLLYTQRRRLCSRKLSELSRTIKRVA